MIYTGQLTSCRPLKPERGWYLVSSVVKDSICFIFYYGELWELWGDDGTCREFLEIVRDIGFTGVFGNYGRYWAGADKRPHVMMKVWGSWRDLLHITGINGSWLIDLPFSLSRHLLEYWLYLMLYWRTHRSVFLSDDHRQGVLLYWGEVPHSPRATIIIFFSHIGSGVHPLPTPPPYVCMCACVCGGCVFCSACHGAVLPTALLECQFTWILHCSHAISSPDTFILHSGLAELNTREWSVLFKDTTAEQLAALGLELRTPCLHSKGSYQLNYAASLLPLIFQWPSVVSCTSYPAFIDTAEESTADSICISNLVTFRD